MNNKLYDILKWIVVVLIPAAIVFCNTCLPLYGVSAEVVNIIVTTASAVATFIGALIAVSTVKYNKEADK